MNPSTWHKIREVLELTLELPEEERTGFLDERCAGDDALRADVEAFLEASSRGGTLLDRPVIKVDQKSPMGMSVEAFLERVDELEAGRPIGEYRIAKQLDEGGMGAVYLAHRDGDEDDQVAIKVAKVGLPSRAQRRVRNESRILAELDHPTIARVLDAGTTADGRPYFVMDYIQGTPIDEYCEEKELSVAERLKLFIEVCSAVEAAHRQGVIHRDVKPSNILVTANGVPKLLDFGIAKLLDPEAVDFTVDGTRTSERFLTPQYASPEQIRGEEITPRSDVYSLGALLYKLVTGRLPYVLERYTARAMERALENQSPPLPSEAVASSPARTWHQKLGSDLDLIVMKAISLEPDDRYSSVEALAQDLEGYLQGKRLVLDKQPPSRKPHLGIAEELSDATVNPWLQRFWVPIGALILILILVLVLGTFFLGREGATSPWPDEKVSVVLGGFQNETNDPLLDRSLDLVFRTGIEQSPSIDVLSDREIRAALERMQLKATAAIDRELGVQICLREGAQAFVQGTVVRVGPSYAMSAQLISAEDEILQTLTASASTQAEILPALERLVRDLRSSLGESLASVESSPPLDKVTTSDLEALRYYSLGVDTQYQNDIPGSIGLFNRALERDSEFAMAHAQLGVAYRKVGLQEKVLEHFSQALKHKNRLSAFERTYIEGWMANQYGTPEDMIRAWTLVASLFPDNETGYHNIATVNRLYLNQFEAAADAYRRELLVSEPRRRLYSARPLGYCELALGRYDVATSIFEKEASPPGLIDAYFAQERYREGLEALAASYGDSGDDSLLYKFLYHADRGQMAQARPLAQQLIKIYDHGQHGRSMMLVARMMLITTYLLEDSDGLDIALGESLRKASEIFYNETDRLFTTIPFMTSLGKIHARRLELEPAKAIYDIVRERVERLGIDLWRGYLKMLEGEILISQGKVAEAIVSLEVAVSRRDPYQAHESLAYALELAGDVVGAIEENRWIEQRRGRAFSECINVCGLKPKNILDWNLALFHLGRLHEASGQVEKAKAYYRRFLERWSDADAVPPLKEATARLGALENQK